MLFSSITFLMYFLPISLIGYYLLAFSKKLQNLWLLVVSLFFYAWGEPVFVLVLMGSVVVNWISGLLINSAGRNSGARKAALFMSCVFNLAILGTFKYANTIVDFVYGLTKWEPFADVPEMALPIGLSFYTFQALSYIIDVYKKDATVQKNPLYLGLYLTFFPQLLAGPIVRYNLVEKQITSRKHSFNKFSEGCWRFSVGLIKKVLIANNMAVVVDKIFSLTKAGVDIKEVPVLLAWTGAIAFCIQIYYDFSGYSDMAIGLGKMFGFEFPENFKHPFIAKSINDFIGRWHITLKDWFHDYVYKPLGGSRMRNDDLMVRNLLIVMLLMGLWHGITWTFVTWGLALFAFTVLEKVTGWEKWRIPVFFKHFVTILIVMILFVLFRAKNMDQFFEYGANMLGINGNGFFSDTALMIWKEYFLVFIFGFIFMMPLRELLEKKTLSLDAPKVIRAMAGTFYLIAIVLLLVFSVITVSKGGDYPFIYFNF